MATSALSAAITQGVTWCSSLTQRASSIRRTGANQTSVARRLVCCEDTGVKHKGLGQGQALARFAEQTSLRLLRAAPPSPMLYLTAGSTAAPQGAAAGAAQSDVRAR